MQQTIALLIRQRRKELGLTQAALAERIHVSAKAVSKWERAGGLPDASIIPALSEALGVSTASLLHGRVETNPPDGGNMKRIKFYQCPTCGNILPHRHGQGGAFLLRTAAVPDDRHPGG